MENVWKITRPGVPPITLEEMKTYLGISLSVTDHDFLIQELLEGAMEMAERAVPIAMTTQTIEQYFDCWPNNRRTVELIRGPLTEIVSVTYTDSSGSTATWSASNYDVDIVSKKPRLGPKYSLLWPTVQPGINAIKVEYKAGHGGPNSVPKILKQIIRWTVSDWFQNRENAMRKFPTAVGHLINRVKIRGV